MIAFTGAQNGLKLVLNIEQYEHTQGPSTDAGVKVNTQTNQAQMPAVKVNTQTDQAQMPAQGKQTDGPSTDADSR